MFDKLGQFASLLKNAGQIQQNMRDMQARLTAARFTAESGGGQVQATVSGAGELISVKIAPPLVQGGDVELIEDLICAAVRQATVLSREAVAKEMGSLAPGLDLSSLGNLLGGPR
jgi:hypothetical protein